MLDQFLNHPAIGTQELEYLKEFAEHTNVSRFDLSQMLDDYEKRVRAAGDEDDTIDVALIDELLPRVRNLTLSSEPDSPGWTVVVATVRYLIEDGDGPGDTAADEGLGGDRRVVDAAEQVLKDVSLGEKRRHDESMPK